MKKRKFFPQVFNFQSTLEAQLQNHVRFINIATNPKSQFLTGLNNRTTFYPKTLNVDSLMLEAFSWLWTTRLWTPADSSLSYPRSYNVIR